MKQLFNCFTLLLVVANAISQQQVNDSIPIENLEEVLIKSVRVASDSPITHSNLDKNNHYFLWVKH